MNSNDPLVSIIVITYNSGKFILETLESIRKQTYDKVELIISDDCSKDNTLDICWDWLKENGSRFRGAHIIESRLNTGVSPNLNRGIKASSGSWIKVIAGDDALTEDAICEFLNHAVDSNSEMTVSKLELFGATDEVLQRTAIQYNIYYEKLLGSQAEQLSRIYSELYIPGPGIFFSRELYININGFDEHYPFCEEWPFYFEILSRGHHIKLLDKKLVKYRVNEGSLSRAGNKMDKRVFDGVYSFFIRRRRMRMIKNGDIIPAINQSIGYYMISKSYENDGKTKLYCLMIKLQNFKHFFKKIMSDLFKFKITKQ
jgi:alpha-1,3-rhamnosyltransferase